MSKIITRASSINRALDQIGDKWCLLIIQEVFWGINSFNEMMETTGVSRGVLSDRLKWLQSVDCLRKAPEVEGGKRMRYHLTPKSMELYDVALMALAWERQFYSTPALDEVALVHRKCGKTFTPQMRCAECDSQIRADEVRYEPGPGATRDERDKKVRRRSSISVTAVPSKRSVYRNLINIVGDRWTANVIALSFHGLRRFDQFHRELPVATNILTDRLKFLVQQGIFEQHPYQVRPVRNEYRLSVKGEAIYPFFLALLQWGDRWCAPDGGGQPMRLSHRPCDRTLQGVVRCSACGEELRAQDVDFTIDGAPPETAGDRPAGTGQAANIS